MSSLKASVLVANFNNQNFISECINSLKKQTYKNLEIIFFDDCSNDDSLSAINKYDNIIKSMLMKNHLMKVVEILYFF